MGNKVINDIIKKLEEGIKGQDQEIADILKRNEKEVTDLNKQQLFAGQNSEGKLLGTYKNSKYAALKRLLNPNNVLDLFFTGRFYSLFYVVSSGRKVVIDSKDSKTGFLKAHYGKIFGLNKESKEILAKGTVIKELGIYWRKILRVR